MDITTAQSVLAIAERYRAHAKVFRTQPHYTPGTHIDQWSQICPEPEYSQLCNTLDVPVGTQLSISSILGDLTTHTDGWAIPLRLLWLLSPNSVSVTMGGIEGVYTTGDCCVLNSRKPHNALLVEGEYPQTWILAEVPMDQIPLSVWASVPKEHAVFKDLYYENI